MKEAGWRCDVWTRKTTVVQLGKVYCLHQYSSWCAVSMNDYNIISEILPGAQVIVIYKLVPNYGINRICRVYAL